MCINLYRIYIKYYKTFKQNILYKTYEKFNFIIPEVSSFFLTFKQNRNCHMVFD